MIPPRSRQNTLQYPARCFRLISYLAFSGRARDNTATDKKRNDGTRTCTHTRARTCARTRSSRARTGKQSLYHRHRAQSHFRTGRSGRRLLVRLARAAFRRRTQPQRRHQPGTGSARFPDGQGETQQPLHLWLQEKHGTRFAAQCHHPARSGRDHPGRKHREAAQSAADRRRGNRLGRGRGDPDQRVHRLPVPQG